jgi:cell division septum initiation protein DivIVA
MAEKNSFLNWVGFKESESAAPNSVDRIRELESQLSELRSRRDITTLSREEFEILATETAMAMIKSAQSREAKAMSASERVIGEASRQARDAVEGADLKARSILSGAEARGRKFLSVAEAEAVERVAEAEREAQSVFDEKRREATALAQAARRESERIITEATDEVSDYRNWLNGVISEAERLYKIQTQSLDAAANAISQSRSRLESAYSRLEELHKNVTDNLAADNTVIDTGPKKVISERTKPALAAPAKKAGANKSAAKKKPTNRR